MYYLKHLGTTQLALRVTILTSYQNNRDEFFSQANFALPNRSPSNRNFDDVFKAFILQRNRIKDFQQLTDC